jgi:hypothetical protein
VSEFGKSEAARWDAEYRRIFTDDDPALVTDDLVSFVTIGGFLATIQYQYTTPLTPRWKIAPEFVPGQAVWYHDREHHRHAKVIARVGDQHEAAFLRDLFALRGADPALVDANRNLAKEQAASMLPEAFLGEWGGFAHPCPGVPIPNVTALRRFFLSMNYWVPIAVPAGGPVAPVILATPAGPAEQFRVPPENYHPSRDGNPVSLIVDHWTAGSSIDAAVNRFRDPSVRLSAHYVIGPDGRRVQLVDEADTAYHAGKYEVNLISIGIEHVASPTLPPTAALYAESARLHAEIAARHHIALLPFETVKEHRQVVPTECPGTLDITRIVSEAEEDDMFTEDDRRKLNRVYDHLEAFEPLTWTKRLQQWLAKAIKSVFPNADVSGPDVETGQPFRG